MVLQHGEDAVAHELGVVAHGDVKAGVVDEQVALVAVVPASDQDKVAPVHHVADHNGGPVAQALADLVQRQPVVGQDGAWQGGRGGVVLFEREDKKKKKGRREKRDTPSHLMRPESM